jgi:hypothetical protein
MPGRYTVRVTPPGVAPMTASVAVAADPLPKFTPAERAARQAMLMRVYDWTKALGDARIAARALVSQRDSIKANVGGSAGDSLAARIARSAASVDRAFNAVNGQRGPIEGWSGMPSVDQQKSLAYAMEDATKATAELNRLITAEIPAAYRAAGKTWSRAPRTVTAPRPAR